MSARPHHRHPVIAGAIVLAIAVAVTGCASGDQPSSAATGEVVTSTPPTGSSTSSTTTTVVSTTTASADTSASTGEPTTEEATEPMDDQADDGRCETLTDFDDETSNARWAVVNDDVMGGRSLGGLAFVDGSLVFEGDINTNGGGFSSLRLSLDPEVLVGYDHIRFRARTDGRDYMVTFDDNLSSRDRRVSHRAPIGFDGTGEWQTVSVPFAELFPAIFGRRVDDLPFRPDLATRLGLMISDGLDGPFRLEVDRIELCQGPGSGT